jgi:hypothetical protein
MQDIVMGYIKELHTTDFIDFQIVFAYIDLWAEINENEWNQLKLFQIFKMLLPLLCKYLTHCNCIIFLN